MPVVKYNDNNAVIDKDETSRNLIAFLESNKSFINSSLNLNKPYDEWTDDEVFEKLSNARNEAGLGGIGAFEKSGRIKSFKTRMAVVDKMNSEIEKYKDARLGSIVFANDFSNAAYGRDTDVKNQKLHSVALNWLPFIINFIQDNPESFYKNYKSLEPYRIFNVLSEEGLDCATVCMDMLQLIEDTDMNEFAYNDNDTFVKDFASKYQKLKALSEGSAIIEYIKQQNNNEFYTKTSIGNSENEKSIKVTEAKCRMAYEMLQDYETRMRLISSPYYALFANKDFEKLSVEKINALKKPEGNEALNNYLDSVVAYKQLKAAKATYKDVDTSETLNIYITEVEVAPPKDTRKESEKTMELLESKLKVMFEDNKSSSHYNKVKAALREYYNEESSEDKSTRLAKAINAAAQYLVERNENSYDFRKTRCEDVIELFSKHKMQVFEEQAAENARAEEARQLYAQKENDLQQRVETAHNRAEEYLEKEKAKELQKETAVKASIKEYNEFLETLNKVIANYDALGQKGKTAEDAQNVRKDVHDFYDKYIFAGNEDLDEMYDKEHMEFIPTKMLVDSLKENLLAADKSVYKKEQFASLIKKGVSKRLWDNCVSNDEMRTPISTFLNKNAENVTEQDKMNAYEYALHVIAFKADDLSYNSFQNMGLGKLGRLALNVVDFDESGIDESKNEVLDKLPKEQQEKHKKDSAELISSLSGKDASLYMFLPLKTVDRYAVTMLDSIGNEQACQKIIDKCDKEAGTIKERHDRLTEAINTGDREKLLGAIAFSTGKDQSEFDEVPTADLPAIAKKMLPKVAYDKTLAQIYNTDMKHLLDRPEDYYRKIFLDIDTNRRNEKLSAEEKKYLAEKKKLENLEPDNSVVRREHGYAYVKKVLGLKVMPKESLDKLDDESLYMLVSNLGVIKHMDGNDLQMGIDAISSLQLGDDIKAGIKNTLGSKMPEKKAPLFNPDFDKDIDEKYVMEPFHTPGMYGYIDYKKLDEAKKNFKKKDVEKKIQEVNKPKDWSNESKNLLDLIGDLYLAAGSTPMNAKQLARIIGKNPTIIANQINHMNKMNQQDMFAQLGKGLSPVERMFVEGAKPIIENLAVFFDNAITAKNGLNKKEVNAEDIKEIIKTIPIDIDLKQASDQLNKVANAGETEIIRLMHEATDDCFDQLEGYGVPDLLNEEKSVEKDKETLSYIHNSLRYNKDFGQGKFLQTLMNDYYKEANPTDRRNMLSFIIKGFKNGDKVNEKQVGGDYFASSMKGAGPLMQKMMQGVPEFMVVPELRGAINVVKSDLCPISNSHVKKVIKDIKEKAGKNIQSLKVNERLGAASVAETFSCTVVDKKNKREEVVIKILRPDAKAHMNRELNFMKKAAIVADLNKNLEKLFRAKYKNQIPKHTPKATEAGFLAQLSEIEKEFNFKNEADNIELGDKKYAGKKETVKSVKLFKDIPSSENYLVMTKANGITLDRHIKNVRTLNQNALKPFEVKEGAHSIRHKANLNNITELRKYQNNLNESLELTLKYGEQVKDVAQVWTNEALYGSAWSIFNNYNFRHGDLHSGNIMVDKDNATILDYGNASELHHEKVTIIMKMMSSVVLSRPDFFVDAFEEFLKVSISEDPEGPGHVGYALPSPKVRDEYTKRLKQIFETGTPESSGIKVLLALTTAQELGIKLPMELQNFSQCQQRLENSMAEVRQAAIDLKQNIEKLERLPLEDSIKNSFDPFAVFQREMLKKIFDDTYVYKDSIACAHSLVEEFEPKSITDMIAGTTELKRAVSKGKNVDKELEAHKKKIYSHYNILLETSVGTKNLTADSFPGMIQEFRKVYADFKKEYSEKGKLSRKTKNKATSVSSFFTLGSSLTNLLCAYADTTYIRELHNKAFCKKYDEVAFEKLMAICEVDITSISKNAKIVDLNVNYSKLNKEQENELNEGYIDAMNAIEVEHLKQCRIIDEFTSTLRDPSKDDEFAKGMERVFKENPKMEADYQLYKKYRDQFNNSKLEEGYESLVETRRKMVQLENTIVKDYANLCKTEFRKTLEVTQQTRSMENVMNSPHIPEYVDVIGKIMIDNKVSTYKRLGSKFTDEFNKLEEKQKAEEAAEEAAQNDDVTDKKDNEAKADGKSKNPKGKDSKSKDSKSKDSKGKDSIGKDNPKKGK
ncbi:hypothetical protein SAMN02910369_02638 [Lachnospiraceae bacterium NE2001]|nr:hypothetical protein SAMN02910369_02638 [Lachnospiraceae bacterium NE2001]